MKYQILSKLRCVVVPSTENYSEPFPIMNYFYDNLCINKSLNVKSPKTYAS